MKNNLYLIIPLMIYVILMLFIAYAITKKDKDNNNFTNTYFLGNRSMGSFILAMTIVSTYVGASSFIGGPAVAFDRGLGWVLLACIQMPLMFLTLGVLGKKVAIISRKIKAVTIIDILRARYKSEGLILLLSILMLIFLMVSIIAQFVGGARLFESILQIDYKYALSIFAFIVIFYTSFGGFKVVAVTDAIQGLIMMLATTVLFFVILYKSGGMSNIVSKIYEINPHLLTPTNEGLISKPFILSFWILVGIAILGLPATTIRTMGYKDSKSLHKAMLIGTFVIGFLMIGMHLVGLMGRAVISESIGDKLIPTLALNNLHPILAGVFIGGPLAAIMSSVDSLLILATSNVVKDIYINYINKNSSDKFLRKLTFLTSLTIGLITYLLSINPPALIVFINLFALSGQEVLFFCPLIFGLFYRKGSKEAAFFSIIGGFITFISITYFKINIYGMHYVVPSLFVSVILYLVVSNLTYKKDEEVEKIFFN